MQIQNLLQQFNTFKNTNDVGNLKKSDHDDIHEYLMDNHEEFTEEDMIKLHELKVTLFNNQEKKENEMLNVMDKADRLNMDLIEQDFCLFLQDELKMLGEITNNVMIAINEATRKKYGDIISRINKRKEEKKNSLEEKFKKYQETGEGKFTMNEVENINIHIYNRIIRGKQTKEDEKDFEDLEKLKKKTYFEICDEEHGMTRIFKSIKKTKWHMDNNAHWIKHEETMKNYF